MGELVGPALSPMEIAELAYKTGPPWRDARALVEAVAVCLAECQGYSASWNDNHDQHGHVLSRDCGLWQINIPAKEIGGQLERRLRSDTTYNAQRALALYEGRGWQPWASYNSGIVFDDTYQARALLGVLNFLGRAQVLDQQQLAPARKSHHTLRVPFLTRDQLRHLYPEVELG